MTKGGNPIVLGQIRRQKWTLAIKKHYLNLDPNAPKMHAFDKKHCVYEGGVTRLALVYHGPGPGRADGHRR